MPDPRQFLSRWVYGPLQGILRSDWDRLRDDPAHRVDPSYRVRALLTGIGSRSNSRRSVRETARFEERIRSTRVEAPIFILGHYRSGTTLLHNLMARDPGLGFCNYYTATFPHTFLTTERAGLRLGFLSPSRRPFDGVRVGLREPAEDELALCAMTLLSPHMGWHFPLAWDRYQIYGTFQRANPAERKRWKEAMLHLARKLTVRDPRPLVLKSPHHTARIRMILEVFPDARFVHVRRDPFQVFQSTRRMEAGVRPLFRYQRCDPTGDPDALILDRFRQMYRAFLADRGAVPAGRLVELDYESLIASPLDTLGSVYAGLGLPGFARARTEMARYLESVRGHSPAGHPPMPEPIRQRIREECGFYLDAMGYSGQGRSMGSPRATGRA